MPQHEPKERHPAFRFALAAKAEAHTGIELTASDITRLMSNTYDRALVAAASKGKQIFLRLSFAAREKTLLLIVSDNKK